MSYSIYVHFLETENAIYKVYLQYLKYVFQRCISVTGALPELYITTLFFAHDDMVDSCQARKQTNNFQQEATFKDVPGVQ